jgi:transmembrane sensor
MANMPPPDAMEDDPIHLAATEWLLRLQESDLSLEDTLAWQGWLNADPRHAHAFARMEEVSQVLRSVPVPSAVSERLLAHDSYDGSVPLGDWQPRRRLSKPWLTLALAAVFVGVACAVVFWKTTQPDPYNTAVGENRTITLSDGSTVALGGDTAIDVSVSGSLRAIELKKGEALFTVAKDPTRPFKVRVGDAVIVAVGTAFDVQRDSDRAIVSVTEGRVLVEPTAHFLPVAVLQEFSPKLRSVRLDAGEQTMTGSAGIEEPSRVEDPAAATSWQTGRLAFRLEPLRYVIEDVNRYAPKPIVLEGEGLGSLTITGTVERDNITGWINSLQRVFEVEATEEADRIVIRPR